MTGPQAAEGRLPDRGFRLRLLAAFCRARERAEQISETIAAAGERCGKKYFCMFCSNFNLNEIAVF